jgi:hypothetical protein
MHRLGCARASCAPEVLEGYERLIEKGCGMPLAAALGHERAASRELVRTVTAIAGRRQELLARARAQSKTPGAGRAPLIGPLTARALRAYTQ